MVWLASLLLTLAVAKPLAPIPSESTTLAGHLLPNEFENHLQYPRDQRRGGAVIAVGTFRAFNVAAAVRAQYLIAFDAAASVRRFNEAIADAVLAHSRAEFIGHLLGAGEPLPSREGALSWMRARILEQEAHFPGLFTPGLFEVYRREDPKYDEAIARAEYLGTFEEYFRTPERYAHTFFGSEEAYEHLRGLLRGARFRAVTGRLEGPTAFAEVAYALGQLDARVSVLDVSNALDFIYTREGIGRFVHNVRRLRFSRDGLILFTDHNGVRSPHPEWAYLWSTPEPLLRLLTLTTGAHVDRFREALRDARFEATRLSCASRL